jgi:ABC-2 type transport system permease protein
MTAGTVDGSAGVAAAIPERSGPALTRLTARQTRRSFLVLLGVAAGMTALVAGQYQSTVAGVLDTPAVQALTASPAIRVLFGPPVALDDPGGFTVWRTGTAVAVLVAVWALLTATRLTRGEEQAGRWDLLLAGRTSAPAFLTRVLLVLTAEILIVGAAVGAALVITGTDPAGSILHAAGIAGVGLGFAALGGLSAQLLPTRAAATGAAIAVLGSCLLARMVADGLDTLGWLRWASPFGLLAETRPYAGDHLAPLLPLAAAAVVFGTAAILAARSRDADEGLLPARTARRPRTYLLDSVVGFALRQAVGPLVGWTLGVSAFSLLVGLLAESVSQFLGENPRFTELAAAAGLGGLGTVAGYSAAMFALLSIPGGCYAAVRLAAAAADETSRRVVLLAAQPISRAQTAAAEITAAGTGVAVMLTAGALATWAGTATVGAPLTVGDALAGAFNTLPVALLCVGAAMLTWGVRPVHVAAIGSLPVVGGFLLRVLAPSLHAPAWVGELSPYAHLAPVPDSPPDWAATATLTGVAVALAAVGMFCYTRRDLNI